MSVTASCVLPPFSGKTLSEGAVPSLFPAAFWHGSCIVETSTCVVGAAFQGTALGPRLERLFFTHHTNAGSFLLTCLWDLTSLSTQGLHRKSVGTKYNCFCFKSCWLYLYALNQLKGQSKMLWCGVFIFQTTVPLTQGEGVPCPGSGLDNWSLPNLDWVDWFLR